MVTVEPLPMTKIMELAGVALGASDRKSLQERLVSGSAFIGGTQL